MSEIRVNKVVNSTGDNDSGLDMTTNDVVIIKTANTTAMTVNASQVVDFANPPTGIGSSSNRNFIINGGMTINQRNGDTLTASANNAYNFDRWKIYLNGSCAVSTVRKGSLEGNVVSLNTASGENFNNVMHIDCTTGANLGSSDLLGQIQIIEGYNSVPLAGKSCTLSFWVKTSVAGQYYVAFKIASARSYIAPYTVSNANAWEKKTITLTMDTLANLNTSGSVTNGGGFHVYFGLRLGTSSQQTSTINQWVAGNFYGTSSQVTWGTSASDTFYMSGVQLEISSSATPFNHRSIAEELTLCQRYYYQIGPYPASSGYGILSHFSVADANSGFGIVTFNQTMRSAPSVSHSGDVNDYRLYVSNSNKPMTALPTISSGQTGNMAMIYAEFSGTTTAGQYGLLQTVNNNTDAFIGFKSEL